MHLFFVLTNFFVFAEELVAAGATVDVGSGAVNDCTMKALPTTATIAANTFVIRLIFIVSKISQFDI